MASWDEASLIEAARRGQTVALERLLVRQYEPLARHVAHQLPVPMQHVISVDDIVQQTFSQVFRDIEKFEVRPGSTFLGWLKTIAGNRIRDACRAEQRLRRGGGWRRVGAIEPGDSRFVEGLLSDYVAATQTPSGEIARREAVQAVRGALVALPDDYRRVIELRYFEGRSVDEVAEQLGKTAGAVRGLQDRAKARLAELLERASRYLSND